MKNFISAAEIEELAAQGVRELTVDEDTVLTAVAQLTAAQRGIKLLAPGAAAKNALPAAAAAAPVVVSGKPKGCQHGPLSGGAAPRPTASGASPVVDGVIDGVIDGLIGAVKQMARH